MSHEIKMPRLDDEVDEGVLVTWFVTPGQQVHTGQRIAELQVEKVSSELEATVDGRLVELRVEPGEVVQFGEVIAVMDDGPVEAVELGTAPAPGEDVRSEQPPPAVKASPAARRVAHELGVDLAGIDGSGPNGRIVERDVRDAATAPAEPPHETGRPLSPLRRTMAQKLHHWVSETAQFTLSAEADVTNLAEALRALRAGGRGPSYLAAVVRATALTLRGHPGLTSQLVDGTRLVVPDQIGIGVAVAVDDGLLVPVLRAADTQSVDSLHDEIQDLAARARKGALGVDEQRGAVFSITNLGGHRVDAFTPLLSPGESAILGIGRARLRPAVVDDQLGVRMLMVLSMTVDHRIIDGDPAAAFLDDLLGLLEHPDQVSAGSFTTSWLGS